MSNTTTRDLVLAALVAHPGSTVKQLASHAELSKADTQHALASMSIFERYAELTVSLWHPTEAGLKAHREAEAGRGWVP